MCMIKIRPTIRLAAPIEAYKIVNPPYVGPFSQTEISRGEWMEAKCEPKEKTALDGVYQPGFHVYRRKADADYGRFDIGPAHVFGDRVLRYNQSGILDLRPDGDCEVEKVLIAGLATGGTNFNRTNFNGCEACAAQYIYFYPEGETSCSTPPPSS